jgi:hypothetical protein
MKLTHHLCADALIIPKTDALIHYFSGAQMPQPYSLYCPGPPEITIDAAPEDATPEDVILEHKEICTTLLSDIGTL